MARMDYGRAKQRDHRANLTSPEIQNRVSAENAKIIAGMGQGPRAPLKRIDPNSPEGRAIAARFTG